MAMKPLLLAILTCILLRVASEVENLLCNADGSCRDVEDEALLQFHASSTGRSNSSHCDTKIDSSKNFCCWSKTCNGDAACCSSCGPQGACQFPDGDGYGVSQQGTCTNDPANQCPGSNATDDTEVAFCDIEVDKSMNFCCWSKACHGDADCCSSCGPQGACQFPDGDGYGARQQGTCANAPANQCGGACLVQVNATQEAKERAGGEQSEATSHTEKREKYCDVEIDHSRPFCCWSTPCKYEKDPAACCASCGPRNACQFPNDKEHRFGLGGDRNSGTCFNSEVNQCPIPTVSDRPTASDDTFCDVELDKARNFCCWSKACNGDAECCSSCELQGSCQFPDGDGYGVNQQGTCAKDLANQCAGVRLAQVNATEKMKETGNAVAKRTKA